VATVAEAPPSGPSNNLGPYLLGGVGAAGIAGYALLTYWGRKDNDKLAECSPGCMPASVDHIKKLYMFANVSLGVGAAALVGAGTWLYLKSRSSQEVAARPASVALDVQPLPRGALATVRGAF
jgi:hypothetical protein